MHHLRLLQLTLGALAVSATAAAEEVQARAASTEDSWREAVRAQLTPRPHPEPPDPDPFAFSAYRGARPEPMGEGTLINGASMKIASLLVKDPPHVVENTYYEALAKVGVRPLAGRLPRDPGVRYLSFRAPKSRNLKTVTLIPNGSGTLILASVGNPEQLLRPPPKLPAEVPVPPDSVATASIQQVEQGGGTRSASFIVRNTTVEQVRSFYRRQLSTRGFSHSVSDSTESFERADLRLSLRLAPARERDSVSVHMVFVQ